MNQEVVANLNQLWFSKIQLICLVLAFENIPTCYCNDWKCSKRQLLIVKSALMHHDAASKSLHDQVMFRIQAKGIQGGYSQRQARNTLGRNGKVVAQTVQKAQQLSGSGPFALTPVGEILPRQNAEMHLGHQRADWPRRSART
ncbi:hypothetical protein [Herbaspirillum sp. NPDC087042]|uniref:hypothetical protein n=1 Tax=Herbaspirillum sp. NPDC087042 TaxID=3364004 RepID=UPI0038285BBA